MTAREIYDTLSRTLTDWETGDATATDLYEILCEIQCNWEYITASHN